MADANPQLAVILREALDAVGQRHTLMVIPQPAELRQYLADSLRAGRSPAAIVLNISDPGIGAVVAWIRTQRNSIAEIPIVGVGESSKDLHLNQIDTAVNSPTTALLATALRFIMKRPSFGGR